jgi:putative aminopeptidase FrvX
MSKNGIAELLGRLSVAYGPSGYEDNVRTIIIDEIRKSRGKPRIDSLGNVYAEIKGASSGPRIMVSAHMDEVGFIVKFIEDSGFLRFGNLGIMDPRVLLAQRVLVNGLKPVIGVVGSKPPHVLTPDEAKKAVEMGDLYIDIGASSRAEVSKLGIDVGTTGTFDVPFKHTASGSMVVGKALDNRAGCAAALKLFESLSRKPPRGTTVFAFTVQEELGMRGATVAANSAFPEVAIVFECAVAADSPDVRPRDRILTVGKGPAVRVMDNSMITQRLMYEYVRKTAETHRIPYQIHINFGGATDAGKIHLSGRGIPTGVLSVPCRYLHSASLMLDLLDLGNMIRLAEYAVRGMNSADMFNYKT